MNILVTGASGFLGRNLLRFLKENKIDKKHQVYLLTSVKISGFKCILHNNYTFSRDVFSSQGLFTIDVLIHIGAFTPKNPAEFDNINKTTDSVVTTCYLLNNLPGVPKKLIYISSVSVYSFKVVQKITENTIPIPDSLYGWSKLYSENILRVYARTNGSKLNILRLGVIYGGGDKECERIIPQTLKTLIKKAAPVIVNGGKQLCSFIHVKDVCRIICKTLECESIDNEIINCTSPDYITVKDLVYKMMGIVGIELIPEFKTVDKVYTSILYDTSIFKKYFGHTEISYEQGILEEYKYFMSIKDEII